MERIEQHACFGGQQEVWEHRATSLGGVKTRFGIYLPPGAGVLAAISHQNSSDAPGAASDLSQARTGGRRNRIEHPVNRLAGARAESAADPKREPDGGEEWRLKMPVLYWLSGLTCTAQNFITKAGAQRYAAEHGVILVAPDTSPRGEGVAEDARWSLGQGAGFYVNASESPWAAHYQMFDYVTRELPALIEAHFPANGRRSVGGHSMGGHGALIAALKSPGRYQSVSAMAPIVAPSRVPWGEVAFEAYLGPDKATWQRWDACALVSAAGSDSQDSPQAERLPILIDQGDADDFLEEQLQPWLLGEACTEAGHPIDLRMQPGHDHSFYFVSTFIGDHIAHHARALKGLGMA